MLGENHAHSGGRRPPPQTGERDWMRIGADTNRFLRSRKAVSAFGVHTKALLVEVKAVRGAAT